jgi:hypothetical protein
VHAITVAGLGIVGFVIGEIVYVVAGGRPPVPTPTLPWWGSLLMVSMVAVWVFRQPNRRLRIAVPFSAAVFALPYAHHLAPPHVLWALSAAAHAAPFRYWTVYNWHSILDRLRGNA